jgi:hypothetical protein
MLKWLSKSILGYGAKQFVRHVNPERPLQVVVAADHCLNTVLMQLDTYCNLTVCTTCTSYVINFPLVKPYKKALLSG